MDSAFSLHELLEGAQHSDETSAAKLPAALTAPTPPTPTPTPPAPTATPPAAAAASPPAAAVASPPAAAAAAAAAAASSSRGSSSGASIEDSTGISSSISSSSSSGGGGNGGNGGIQAIDQSSIHRICSGQVILDLATAIKELVENALDAGASVCDVKLVNHGQSTVSVSDNAGGIAPSDREGLARKHWTSKLRQFDDLEQGVSSFGFRGEALSSLCALAKLMVVTCCAEDSVAAELTFAASGELEKSEPAARGQGTTVTLEHLFEPLPVRHTTFLRNLKREYGKAMTLLQAYALVAPHVKFSVIHVIDPSASSGKESGGVRGQSRKRQVVFRTRGDGSLKNTIISVFGSKQLQALSPIDVQLGTVAAAPADDVDATAVTSSEQDKPEAIGHTLESIRELVVPEEEEEIPKSTRATFSVRMSGYLSKQEPKCGRASADRQFFSLNGRPVDVPRLNRTINDAYRSTNNHSSYPVVMINFELPPERLDVNVTPNKRQVFLHEEARIAEGLKSTLLKLWAPSQSTFQVKPIESFINVGIKDISSANGVSSLDTGSSVPAAAAAAGAAGAAVSMDDDDDDDDVTGVDNGIEDDCLESGDESNDPIMGAQKVEGPSNAQSTGFHLQSVLGKRLSSSLDASSSSSDSSDEEETQDVPIMQDEEAVPEYLDFSTNSSVKPEPNLNSKRQAKRVKRKTSSSVDDSDAEAVDDDASNASANGSDGSSYATEPEDEEDEQAEAQEDFQDDPVGSQEDLVASQDDEWIRAQQILRTAGALVDGQVTVPAWVCSNDGEMKFDMDQVVQFAGSSVDDGSAIVNGMNFDGIDTGNATGMTSQAGANESSDDSSAVNELGGDSTARTASVSEDTLRRVLTKQDFLQMRVIGQFNLGFIGVQLRDDLFIIDQHASDEKFRFETLQASTTIQKQLRVVPLSMQVSPDTELVMREYADIFAANGFDLEFPEESSSSNDGDRAPVQVLSVPFSKRIVFGAEDVQALCALLSSGPPRRLGPCGCDMPPDAPSTFFDTAVYRYSGKLPRPPRVRRMFASRACRSAVMIGTALKMSKMKTIVEHMATLDMPWACPHGRPTMRHLVDLSKLRQLISEQS